MTMSDAVLDRNCAKCKRDLTNGKSRCYNMTYRHYPRLEECTMFELSAAHLLDADRERELTAALRRRRLLAELAGPARVVAAKPSTAQPPRRDVLRTPARAER
jgi:hypothetical protein